MTDPITLLQGNFNISTSDIDKAAVFQKKYSGRLEQILVNMGAMSEDSLPQYYASLFDIPMLTEDALQRVSPESLQAMPLNAELHAYDWFVISYDESKAQVTVAVSDPLSVEANQLLTESGLHPEFFVADSAQVQLLRQQYLQSQAVTAVNDELSDLEEDEFIKPSTTVETLGGLKASFEQLGSMGFDAVALQRYPQVERIHHVHHAGNSSGIVDGAAAVLIGSEAAGKTHGLTPRARIVSVALSGADPTIMLTGPMPAARKALAKAGLTIDQIDLFEVNEAFAAVPMKFMQEMGVSHDKVNVNGGAIAMGHPLGATGAMILGILIDELHRRQLRYGLATLCVGGGMGIATIVERV